MDKDEILKRCNEISHNTLMQTLDIEFVDLDEDSLTARMPVTHKVHQPEGLLHGGATVALAESVGSAASHVFLDTKNYAIRGLEISANHVRSIAQGYVYATARIMHKGRTTQLWQIDIKDTDNRLISMVKLTTIALKK